GPGSGGATAAPATVGVPSTAWSPPTTRTSPNCTTVPGSASSRSTRSTSSAATRYCLPPVLMTANISFVLCVHARYSGPEDPDRLLAIVTYLPLQQRCVETTPRHNKARGRKSARATALVMAIPASPVNHAPPRPLPTPPCRGWGSARGGTQRKRAPLPHNCLNRVREPAGPVARNLMARSGVQSHGG